MNGLNYEKIHEILIPCVQMYENKQLADYELVGVFILSWLASLRPKRYLAGCVKSSNDSSSSSTSTNSTSTNSILLSQLPASFLDLLDRSYLTKFCASTSSNSVRFEELRIIDVFRLFRLSNVAQTIGDCLVNWSLRRFPFRLMFRIPSPMEVLQQQSESCRVITVFISLDELRSMHRSPLAYMKGHMNHERNAFDFLTHDMQHMTHFKNEQFFDEQVGFSRSVLRLSNGDPRRFLDERGGDETLWNEIEYVISDMNCVSCHLMSYFKAKWLLAHKRTQQQQQQQQLKSFEDCFDELLQQFGVTDREQQVAFRKQCGAELQRDDAELIRAFFISKGKSD